MEIEIKPISLDDRLEYITKISENQQANTKKIPWVAIIISAVIGIGITYLTLHFQKKKDDTPK